MHVLQPEVVEGEVIVVVQLHRPQQQFQGLVVSRLLVDARVRLLHIVNKDF